MLANVILALLLVISAVAKLRSPDETRDAFVSLKLPRWLAKSPAPVLLPWGELLLAVLLVVSSGWLLILATVGSVVLFAIYTVLIGRALRFEEAVSCNCFGVLGAQGVSGRTLVRNVVLLALAILGLVAAVQGQSFARLAELAVGWDWVVVAALSTAALFLSLDGGTTAASAPPAAAGSWVAYASLTDASTSAQVTMRQLGARGGGATVVFLRPGCGSCERLVDEWADATASAPRPTIPVSPTATIPDTPGWASLQGLMVDTGSNLGMALTGGSTPAAVVIGADGQLVGEPAIGLASVRELINGGPKPETDEPATEPEGEPEPLDYIRRPIPQGVVLDSSGAPTTLTKLASQQAQLIVGIDCLCSDARSAMASLEEWQARLPILGVRLLVPFTLQPGTLTSAQHKIALYDHEGLVSKQLQLKGAASAVLLGADGLLAGGPVTGFGEVEAFVADIAEQLAEA